MKLRPCLAFAFALASLLPARLATAGVVLAFEVTSPREAKPSVGTIWVEPDRLRMETQGQSVIYRGDKQVMWYLQPSQGSYMEMNKEGMQQVAGMMAAAQAQMASLPPEQRAMLEKYMGGQAASAGAAAKKPVTTIKKTGETATINGYATTAFDVLLDGKPHQQAWVTDWKQFDLTAADFKVFEEFADFMKDLTSSVSRSVANGFVTKYSDTESGDALPGVPIRTISILPDGKATYELKKVTRETIASTQFEVPAGLRKQDMTMPH